MTIFFKLLLKYFFLFLLKYFFIYLFIFIYFWLRWVFVIACGLSLDAASRDYSSFVVHGLLVAVASLVVQHGL